MKLQGSPPHRQAPVRHPDRGHESKYRGLIRANWRAGSAVLAATLAAGLGLHFAKEPEYTARTDVVVVAVSDLALSDALVVDVSIDSAVQLLLSDRVLGRTARSLDYPGGAAALLDDVTVSPVVNSRILQLYVSAPEARTAYRAVAALSENFLEVRSESLAVATRDRAETIAAQKRAIERSMRDRSITGASNAALRVNTNTLSRQHAQLEAELSALSVHDPEPGYISRPAVLPDRSKRLGLSTAIGSSLAAGLALAAAMAARSQRRHEQRSRPNEGRTS